jgi:hypothetical protein
MGLGMLNMWPWQMGDPSVEVSQVAFQEAEGGVESNSEKVLLFPSLVSTSSDQAVFCFLIYVYFGLLIVRESGIRC